MQRRPPGSATSASPGSSTTAACSTRTNTSSQPTCRNQGRPGATRTCNGQAPTGCGTQPWGYGGSSRTTDQGWESMAQCSKCSISPSTYTTHFLGLCRSAALAALRHGQRATLFWAVGSCSRAHRPDRGRDDRGRVEPTRSSLSRSTPSQAAHHVRNAVSEAVTRSPGKEHHVELSTESPHPDAHQVS